MEDLTAAELDVLCDRCLELAGLWWSVFKDREALFPDGQPKFKFSRSFQKIMESSRAGCHFCTYFWKYTRDEQYAREAFHTKDCDPDNNVEIYPDSVDFPLERRVPEGDLAPDVSPIGKIGLSYDVKGRPYFMTISIQEVETYSETRTWSGICGSKFTGSGSTIQQIRSWLRTCEAEHPRCSAVPAEVSCRPEYLIEIMSVSANDVRCKLVRTALIESPSTEWVTLSYCWGHGSTLTTVESNLEEHLCLIPPEAVPRLYQEAIKTTFMLGYRYIWIDSLCIIQDTKLHWVQESTIMGDVYRGSTLNIAALASEDCCSPLWKPRNPLAFLPVRVPVAPGWVATLVAKDPFLIYEERSWRYSTAEPLVRRAWVVQEVVLAPRTVYFGTSNVYFDCQSHAANSSLPDLVDLSDLLRAQDLRQTSFSERPVPSKQLFGKVLAEPELPACNTIQKYMEHLISTPAVLDFIHMYASLVEQYTKCCLTFEEDKLVAINGIVQKLRLATGLTPLAGLWKELLPLFLLWRPYKQGDTCRGRSYVAPSWSWASLHGPVNIDIDYHLRDPSCIKTMEILTDVVDTHLEDLQSNGHIRGGWLRLQGPMRKVRVVPFWLGDFDIYPHEFEYDLESFKKAIHFRPDYKDWRDGIHDDEVWLLLLTKNDLPDGAGGFFRWCMGLVVAKVQDSSGATAGEEMWKRISPFGYELGQVCACRGNSGLKEEARCHPPWNDPFFGDECERFIKQKKTVTLI